MLDRRANGSDMRAVDEDFPGAQQTSRADVEQMRRMQHDGR
jgi:hypothetical protein